LKSCKSWKAVTCTWIYKARGMKKKYISYYIILTLVAVLSLWNSANDKVHKHLHHPAVSKCCISVWLWHVHYTDNHIHTKPRSDLWGQHFWPIHCLLPETVAMTNLNRNENNAVLIHFYMWVTLNLHIKY